MRNQNTLKKIAGIVAIGLVMTGCNSGQDALSKQATAELVANNLDAHAVDVSEAIKAATQTEIEESDPTSENLEATANPSQDVVLRAKVGSGKGDTFDPAISAFLVSEIPAGEHADTATHDSSNCPFCRAREAKAPTVMVRLVGKDGQPFKRSADQLLGLTKGQHVVVKGTGQFDQELNFYTVEANTIQILK